MDERRLAFAAERWVREHQQELISDLKGLIEIRSVAHYGEEEFPMGSECAKAVDYLLALGDKYGLAIENDAYYNASLLLPGKGTGELGILGHLDIVPEGSGWRYSPYIPVLKNGILIGRGSRDNKGPLIAALYLLRCFKALDVQFQSSIRLIAGCDEELEMRDIKHYLTSHCAPDFTLNCDGAWAVCGAEKGMIRAEIRVDASQTELLELHGGNAANCIPDAAYACVSGRISSEANEDVPRPICIAYACDATEIKAAGRTAHSSTPHRGINAIVCLLNFLAERNDFSSKLHRCLQALEKCISDADGMGLHICYEDALSGKTTCTPTQIRYENGEIRLLLDIRYAVSQNPDALIFQMRKRCEKLGLSMQILYHSPARITDANDPVLKLLLNTCRTYLGRRYRLHAMSGGTYSRIFPHSLPFGMDILEADLVKGIGEPHGPDESVRIEDLLRSVTVYAASLHRLDQYFHS